jgi:hypothetical protein
MKRKRGTTFLLDEGVGNERSELVTEVLRVYIEQRLAKSCKKLTIVLDNCRQVTKILRFQEGNH